MVIAMREHTEYDSIYDTIRRNIRKYRKEKGLTSAQLAEMVGLSHDFIRQIESEKTRYIVILLEIQTQCVEILFKY